MLGIIDRLKALKTTPLFSSLSFDDLGELAKITAVRTFSHGARIITEGDPGDSMFIIIQGKVKIFRVRGSQEVIAAVLGQYEYFGEMALIDEKPRTASVEALDETVLLCIYKKDFKNLLLLYPEISFEMLRIFSERFRERIK